MKLIKNLKRKKRFLKKPRKGLRRKNKDRRRSLKV